MNVVVLAASAPTPLAILLGVIVVILLPVGVGMAVGWLLSLPARVRSQQDRPPAVAAPVNPARKPGGKR